MENSSGNTTSDSQLFSSTSVFSETEVIAWCSTFTLASFLIVAGNLLTIVLFVVDRKLRVNCFFLVINMASADLMLGAVSLPIFVAQIASWTARTNSSVGFFRSIFSVVFLQASITFAAFISGERFYATYWPLKHRTLSRQTYAAVIFLAWTLVLLSSAILSVLRLFVSKIAFFSFWVPYTFTLTLVICGCNIAIQKRIENGRIVSIQRSRALQNRRLTNTLLFISFLVLLSWIPLIIISTLDAFRISTNENIYYMAVLLNVSNCCVNPVVYALRIPEFRKALGLFCCCGTKAEATHMSSYQGRYKRGSGFTSITQLKSPSFDPEVMDTKL
ncbi:adenosine receptor A3-like [Oculina patagonica]